jgi:hypothetical protein
VAPASELSSQFTPLRSAAPRTRALVLVFGPLLWLVAIVVVGIVLHWSRAVELGLIVTVIAFVFSLVASVAGGRRRLREERDAAAP